MKKIIWESMDIQLSKLNIINLVLKLKLIIIIQLTNIRVLYLVKQDIIFDSKTKYYTLYYTVQVVKNIIINI